MAVLTCTDHSVNYWRSLLEYPECADQFDSHLVKAALYADRIQLEDLALVWPNLVAAVREKRGME